MLPEPEMKANIPELASILRLDPDTGKLYWRKRVRSSRAVVGEEAGCVSAYGYIIVSVYRRRYMAHRVVWALTTGEWPSNEIDHINRDKKDNRFANLRQVTSAENKRNICKRADNTSGVKGVSWDSARQKWRASIKTPERHVNLGRFDTLPEAASAYAKAASIYFKE